MYTYTRNRVVLFLHDARSHGTVRDDVVVVIGTSVRTVKSQLNVIVIVLLLQVFLTFSFFWKGCLLVSTEAVPRNRLCPCFVSCNNRCHF